MTTTQDSRTDLAQQAHDRSPAVREEEGQDSSSGWRQQMTDGRWPLYAAEVVMLLIMFGWMAVTNLVAGGHGPL
jgi:hypothetical protein